MSTVDEVADVSATQTAVAEGRPRNPWIAAALAIFCGTTGLVYCGRFRRALLWVVGALFVLIAMSCLLYLPNGRIACIAMAVLLVGYNLSLIVDTIRIARRREPARRWYQRWWYYLAYLIATQLVLLGIVQVSRLYWRETFVIPTGSMAPTVMAGDRIFVEKLLYRTTPVRHGDVIVFGLDNRRTHFEPGPAPPGRLNHVKRVVGLPGDTIEFRDEKLFRNGAVVEEPYAVFSPASGQAHPHLINTPATVVGENELFVVGDNRRESLDSRVFGCIPREDVVGKVAIIYWSREVPPEVRPSTVTPHVEQSSQQARRIRWERFGQRVE